MRKDTLVSKVVGLDYRISRTPSTVTIEVLDYHAEPLTITKEQLLEFGLVMISPSEIEHRPH